MNKNMNSEYLCSDFSKIEKELSKQKDIRIEINEGLETALSELQQMNDRLADKEAANLVELCKDTVIDTITAQFGLLGVFLCAKDGGNVTTAHNFEKGITATSEDKARYDSYHRYETDEVRFCDVRKELGYDNGFHQKRKEAFQTNDIIIDEYTGKPLPKNGQAHLDHIVSAKEIETNAKANLFLSPEERAKIATSDPNLAFTEAKANMSKSDDPMAEWLSKKDKKTGQTKAEKYDIDTDRAMKKDSDARRYIKKQVDKAAVKKYTSELVKTGCADAAAAGCGTVIGLAMRDIAQVTFEEIHRTIELKGTENFSDVLKRFRTSLDDAFLQIKDKWKDLLEECVWASVTAFLSNLIVFLINLVATTLKKLVIMIRAGFVSIVQAVRILSDPPEGMPYEEVKYQAFKILVTGLITAGSLGLSDAIEKLLLSVSPVLLPIMNFPLPMTNGKTISDAIAGTLSALAGGLISTIVLYYMDKFREQENKDNIRFQIVSQSNVVVQYRISQTWMCLEEAYRLLGYYAADFADTISQTQDEINKSGENAAKAVSKVSDRLKQLETLLRKK